MKKIYLIIIVFLLIPKLVFASCCGSVLEENRNIWGAGIAGMAVTDTLYVSPDGNASDGSTWLDAYTTIQSALDAASTDTDDCTLIMISPHTTYYDIDTTSDPTWSANVILMGPERNWTKVMNEHASATSILKLTGKVGIYNLNFNLGDGSGNGVILTHGGCVVHNCMFVGEDLTGAATALHFDGASTIKHGVVNGHCLFKGHATYMTAIKIDNASYHDFSLIRIHDCLNGIQFVNANSDGNIFNKIDIGDSAIGLNIDGGDTQHFYDIIFHDNTLNVDDEEHNHIYTNVYGALNMDTLPDNLTGVTITSHATANTWGSNSEVLSAASRTKPFRVIGYFVVPSASELRKVRLSADGGTTYFDEIIINATKQVGEGAPAGTEQIFNDNTQIVASMKSESAGPDTAVIWVKIQEI